MVVQKKIYFDVGFSLFLVVVLSYFAATIENYIDIGIPSTVSPALFPTYIAYLFILFSVIYFILSLINLHKMRQGLKGKEHVPQIIASDSASTSFIYLCILLAYYLCFERLGFVISTPVIMAIVTVVMGHRNLRILFPGYVVFTLLIYFVTLEVLKIQLPQGLLTVI